jgi:hypothetical protein
MTVFLDVAPCSLVEVFRHFRGACWLHHQGLLITLMMKTASTSETSVNFYQRWLRPHARLTHRPDDGGSKDLWNVGKRLPDYTALQPRRQPSSYSPPWEPQILLELLPDYTAQHPRRQSPSYSPPWEPEMSPTFHFPHEQAVTVCLKIDCQVAIDFLSPHLKSPNVLWCSRDMLTARIVCTAVRVNRCQADNNTSRHVTSLADVRFVFHLQLNIYLIQTQENYSLSHWFYVRLRRIIHRGN